MSQKKTNYVIRPLHFLPKYPYPGIMGPLIVDNISQRADRVWKEEMKFSPIKVTSPESSQELSKSRLLNYLSNEIRVDFSSGKIFFSRELANLNEEGKMLLRLLAEKPNTSLPIYSTIHNGKPVQIVSRVSRLQLSLRKPRNSKPHILGMSACRRDAEIFQKVDVEGSTVWKLAKMLKGGKWKPCLIDNARVERLKARDLKKLHESLMKQRKRFLTALMYIYEHEFDFDYVRIHESSRTALPDLLHNPEVVAFGNRQLKRLEELSIRKTVSNLRLTRQAYMRKYGQPQSTDAMTEFINAEIRKFSIDSRLHRVLDTSSKSN